MNIDRPTTSIEAAFLTSWSRARLCRCDLKKLPPAFADQPCFQPEALRWLILEASYRQATDPLREAIGMILAMHTDNGGIALQMWCTQVAWLKRRVLHATGQEPGTANLARHSISLDSLRSPPVIQATDHRPLAHP
jgi:hypothetical protein